MDNRLIKVSKEKKQLDPANVILELPITEVSSRQKQRWLKDSSHSDQNDGIYSLLRGQTETRIFGAHVGGIAKEVNDSKDSITFTEAVVSPVVCRTREEKLMDPIRLCLNHRNLVTCPIFEGEEQLKLLNLQHNCITQIQNLNSLRRLVFLDLYDNRIEEIYGLERLFSLRVLMLGRNRIRQITGLEALTKLDVLDLHGNLINFVDNVGHLCHLRVLNLAGNDIAIVEDLSTMQSLTELNFRRNRITHFDCGNLPLLKRLFLSHNLIESTVLSLSLNELTIDGNPFANNPDHRRLIISYLTTLDNLSQHPVSDTERKEALQAAAQEEIKINELQKQLKFIKQRDSVIESVKEEWEARQANPDLPVGKSSFIENGGDTLTLFGSQSLEVLKENHMPVVKHLVLHYMEFRKQMYRFSHIKKSLPTLSALECHKLNLTTLADLHTLCTFIPYTLNSLVISPDGNPVTNHPLYYDYITRLLPNVTVNDDKRKNQYFTLYNQFHNSRDKNPETSDHKVKQRASALANSIHYKIHVHHKMKILFNQLWPNLKDNFLKLACEECFT